MTITDPARDGSEPASQTAAAATADTTATPGRAAAAPVETPTASASTGVRIQEWSPDRLTASPPEGLAALLAAYHLATEAEKAAHGVGRAAPMVADLPERHRAEIDAPLNAFAGRTVLVAELDGDPVGCAIFSELAEAPPETRSDVQRDMPRAAHREALTDRATPAESTTTLGAPTPHRAATAGTRRTELGRLWVDPTIRRTGAGGALVRHAVALAEQRGAASVRLSVWSWRTEAIALYRRNGFVEVPSWDARPDLVCFERRLTDATPGRRE